MSAGEFRDRFPRTAQAYEKSLAAGLQIGAQLYVSRNGIMLADLGWGDSRPGVAMSPNTLMLWLSSGKPVTAVAMMMLQERGQVELDAAVCHYLPEFAQRGKESITIRQLLVHTAGFRFAAADFDYLTWDDAVQRICAMRLENGWIPGQTAGYHPLTSWFILGELAHRIDGRPLAQFVSDEIFLPLEMRDSWIGMSVERYRAYSEQIGLLVNTEKPNRPPNIFSTEVVAALGVPGAGLLAPAHDLGRFYQMLLGGGQLDGVQIMQPETVRMMTDRQRFGMFDQTFRATIDWGLGFLLDSKQYGAESPYGYGRFASHGAFGHSGSQSSAAFADPEFALVVALVFNGTPGEAAHQQRMRRALEAIYADLALNRSADLRLNAGVDRS